MYDIVELRRIVEAKDVNALKSFMHDHDLVLDGSNIRPRQQKPFKDKAQLADFRQFQKKNLPQ
jgi:hypothetical protein